MPFFSRVLESITNRDIYDSLTDCDTHRYVLDGSDYCDLNDGLDDLDEMTSM